MNETGFVPVRDRVLVRPDEVERFVLSGDGRRTNIEKPPMVVDQETHMMTKGTILAIGPDAFANDSFKPEVGDRVVFTMYAGQLYVGEDGKECRVFSDRSIVARIAKGDSNE